MSRDASRTHRRRHRSYEFAGAKTLRGRAQRPQQRQIEVGFPPELRIVVNGNILNIMPKKKTSTRSGGSTSGGPVSRFIQHHYRHFNAAALVDAAEGYVTHLERGGRMMITLAGAMSTAEIGLSLAEMIRRDKVHPLDTNLARRAL